MPTHEQLLIQRLQREINLRMTESKELKQRLYMVNLTLQSVSTLTAQYKVALKNLVEGYEDRLTSEEFRETLNKAAKLLAIPVTEPANHIIRLQGELVQLKGEYSKQQPLIDAQKNMIEQMESEVKSLEGKLETANAKITELGGYVGDV